MTDQPRRDDVEHFAQREAATRGDSDKHFLVVGGSPCRQYQQARSLDLEPLGVAPIASANHFVHKPAIIAEIVKVARNAWLTLATLWKSSPSPPKPYLRHGRSLWQGPCVVVSSRWWSGQPRGLVGEDIARYETCDPARAPGCGALPRRWFNSLPSHKLQMRYAGRRVAIIWSFSPTILIVFFGSSRLQGGSCAVSFVSLWFLG